MVGIIIKNSITMNKTSHWPIINNVCWVFRVLWLDIIWYQNCYVQVWWFFVQWSYKSSKLGLKTAYKVNAVHLNPQQPSQMFNLQWNGYAEKYDSSIYNKTWSIWVTFNSSGGNIFFTNVVATYGNKFWSFFDVLRPNWRLKRNDKLAPIV